MTSPNEPEEKNKALESALTAYKDAWYAGERIDMEAFCRDHPGCGVALKEAIEDFLFVVEQLPYAHRGEKDDAATPTPGRPRSHSRRSPPGRRQ